MTSAPDSELSEFWVHTASVRTYRGMSGTGRTYDAAVTVPCYAEAVVRSVTNDAGVVVVSTTTLYADPKYASAFLVNSDVTVNGRPAAVASVGLFTAGELGLPDHCQVHLTQEGRNGRSL